MRRLLFILPFVLLFNGTPKKEFPDSLSLSQPIREFSKLIHQPSRDRFKLYNNDKYDNPNKLLEKGLIDTNAIYLCSYYISRRGDSNYYFYRFFRDGVLFRSAPYRGRPGEVEFNDLSYGNWSIYTYQEGDIIEEAYLLGAPLQRWHISYYKVLNNGDIVRYQVERRNFLFGRQRSWGWLWSIKNPWSPFKKIDDVNLKNFDIDWGKE